MSATVTRPSRAELARQAQALRAEGKPIQHIATALGVSRSYASELAGCDPLGTRARARKQRYQGVCVDCGGPTSGGDGRAKAPERCQECRTEYQHTEEYSLSKQLWPREVLLARIREWAQLYGEPPAIPDWSPTSARIIGDEARARRFELADGHWPWFTLVVRRFGSWNAALTEAGFEPRVPHGGNGNMGRRRDHGRLHRRAAIAQQLCDEGITLADIARAVYSVWGYKSPWSAYTQLKRAGVRAPVPPRKKHPPHVVLARFAALEAA